MAAPWAIDIFFGAGFAAAAPAVVVMMMVAPVFVLKHLYWQALMSGGHAWASLLLQGLWAMIALSLTWAWQDGGATSLAHAMLAAYGVTLAASIVLVEWIWRQGRRS
jgi:O-antigen/teichoic acid export membrane protein